MMARCEHQLCEIIGGACSLATRRSRGCRPNLTTKDVDPGVFDEVRELLGVIDPGERSENVRQAAVRLAAIVRREALEDRNLLVLASSDEPDLAPALARLCRHPTAGFPFAFFGAGEAGYYEDVRLQVVFLAVPSKEVRGRIEAGIPRPLAPIRWAKRTLVFGTEDFALVGMQRHDTLNAAIDRWLLEAHAHAPIDFAFRAEDGEGGGTRFSEWHRVSLRGGAALLRNLATRYQDPGTRDHVRSALAEMLRAAGLSAGRVPAWRTALDAGDSTALATAIARKNDDLNLALDPDNAAHRRVVLGARPSVAKEHGPHEGKILAMAIRDGGPVAREILETFIARATKKPFWATLLSDVAARAAIVATETAFAVLDRLVELDTAHPVVVENALWAVGEVGPDHVARDRLERYWDHAVAKLADWPALHPYLVKLAPVLGRQAPRPRAPRLR